MAPVLATSLPKSSTCRNLPQDAVYAPKEEGGLGITNLHTFQGCSHIALFVEHIATDSITGQLLQTSLENMQLEVGVGRNLFTLDQCGNSVMKTPSRSLIHTLQTFPFDVITIFF